MIGHRRHRVATTLFPKMKKAWWYPYDRPTLSTFRAFADLVGGERLGTKARAAATILPNAIRAIRRKI